MRRRELPVGGWGDDGMVVGRGFGGRRVGDGGPERDAPRAAAAGEPGCRLKDREPEKPRSRNCHEPRLSRQGVFIHGRKELR